MKPGVNEPNALGRVSAAINKGAAAPPPEATIRHTKEFALVTSPGYTYALLWTLPRRRGNALSVNRPKRITEISVNMAFGLKTKARRKTTAPRLENPSANL